MLVTSLDAFQSRSSFESLEATSTLPEDDDCAERKGGRSRNTTKWNE